MVLICTGKCLASFDAHCVHVINFNSNLWQPMPRYSFVWDIKVVLGIKDMPSSLQLHIKKLSCRKLATLIRPVARLTERGVHVRNMQASGHTTYNLMHFKLSMLYLHNTRLVSGQ